MLRKHQCAKMAITFQKLYIKVWFIINRQALLSHYILKEATVVNKGLYCFVLVNYW